MNQVIARQNISEPCKTDTEAISFESVKNEVCHEI